MNDHEDKRGSRRRRMQKLITHSKNLDNEAKSSSDVLKKEKHLG